MFGCSGLQTLFYGWRAAMTRNTFCILRLPNHTFSVLFIYCFYCWILFFYYFCFNVKHPYVKMSYKQVLFIQKKNFLTWKHNRGSTIGVLKPPLPAYIFVLIPLSCLFFFSNPDPTHILLWVSCLDIEKDTNLPAYILSWVCFLNIAKD